MYLKKWIKHIFILLYFCLFIILMSGFLIYQKENKKDNTNTNSTINKVRLKVSTIMSFIEANADTYFLDNQHSSDLNELCKVYEVDLVTVDLNGNVLFKSDNAIMSDTLSLKNELHYDLYTAKKNPKIVQIAFPIVEDNRQIGNALFQINYSYIKVIAPKLSLWYSLLLLVLIVLTTLLIFLQKSIKRRFLLPINELKQHAKLIVKGDYSQNTDYAALDEVGELYGMFEQLRLELKAMTEARMQQDKLNKELVSNISHDLKTPITALNAYTEALNAGICKDMDSVQEYASIMKIQIEKVIRLADDLTYHFLKELGQLTVKPYEQYSKLIMENILKPIAHYVVQEGREFLGPQLIPDVLIAVDAYRLEQVISNLVSNSLKHTVIGDKIEIKINITYNNFQITIEDSGEGIQAKDMPFIFNRYFQGEPIDVKNKNSNEGAGLGLSICQHIIEAHNGKISFRSEVGKGTIFQCIIPLA